MCMSLCRRVVYRVLIHADHHTPNNCDAAVHPTTTLVTLEAVARKQTVSVYIIILRYS